MAKWDPLTWMKALMTEALRIIHHVKANFSHVNDGGNEKAVSTCEYSLHVCNQEPRKYSQYSQF